MAWPGPFWYQRAFLMDSVSICFWSSIRPLSNAWGVGGQPGDRARPAGRRMDLTPDRERVADRLTGVDVQAGRRPGGLATHPEQQFGPGHRVDVRGQRDRQPEGFGEDRPHVADLEELRLGGVH